MARRALAVLVLLTILIPASAGADTLLWHEDESWIRCVWKHDGIVYMITNFNVHLWTEAGESLGVYPFSPERAPNETETQYIPGDDALWVLLSNQNGDAWLAEVSFDEDMNASLGERVPYDWQSVLHTEFLSFYSPIVLDGILIYASNGVDGLGRLVTYDIERGKSRVIDTDADNYEIDTYFVLPYRDGEALVGSYEQDGPNRMIFYSFDPTGRTLALQCEIPVGDGDFYMPLYDPETDALYFGLDARLCRITGFDPDTLEDLGDVSAITSYVDTYAVTLENGAIAYADWYIMMAYGLPKSENARKLSVSADNSELLNDAYYAFLEQYPDADVALSNEYIDVGEIGKAILTQSTRYDVYLLDLGGQDYAALYDRSYLPALGSDELTALVSGMYETVRDAVEKDGELVALPVDYGINMISCNLKILEAIGLAEADLPETWPEFLALLNRLPALLADTPYSAFTTDMSADVLADQVLLAIMDDYELYLENEPSAEMKFDTQILRDLFAAYEAVDFAAIAPAEGADPDDVIEAFALFHLDDWAPIDAAENARISGYIKSGVETEATTHYMPLALAEGMEPMVPLDLTVAIINPYSENREAAVAYLQTAASLMTEKTRAALTPGWTEQISTEDADARIERMEERIASLEKEVASTVGEDQAAYQALLDEAKENLALQQKFYWAVTDEDLAAYRAYAQYLRVERYFGLDHAGRAEMNDLTVQYLDGAIDADAFITAIDKKINMMLLED